ncbi:hypothetical protein N7539_001377 [Penicillium diatomitis]|uniref:Uncharacterized protein n=1 Tax=Penicillium diatomitis TaxID=2819901 RepID=A0A9W9XGN3_9EURO|nr:uncharacterized protein N7539_001377 [Penicillium diatomitis]KAJ5492631.1 hypothetical protein N7539_001377 [Penicillium diatomitis]
MAPIRRYLRISKHSVLECRIYLDNPADSRWLLNTRDPVLHRVFEAIRPLVLPKLREENQKLWSRKKSKPVKDVIVQDEFEVAIFLRESRTRHALLTRNKIFETPDKKTNKSLKDEPADETMDGAVGLDPTTEAPVVVDSDEGEAEIDLRDIPEACDENAHNGSASIFMGQRDDASREGPATDEKKMRFSTQYESFNITGWVLCLLITRKGDRGQSRVVATPTKQPLMEEWISSQAQTGLGED